MAVSGAPEGRDRRHGRRPAAGKADFAQAMAWRLLTSPSSHPSADSRMLTISIWTWQYLRIPDDPSPPNRVVLWSSNLPKPLRALRPRWSKRRGHSLWAIDRIRVDLPAI